MTNLMTILERKVFISSNPRIVLSSCPPPCGHFSIQESATGGLSYKVKKDTPIRTSANLEKINEWATKKTVLKNLKAGSLYKDDLGNIYIYKYDSQGDTNIPPPQGTWLWQIITVS